MARAKCGFVVDGAWAPGKRRRATAFTLIETIVAVAVIAVSMSVFVASSGQAIRIVKSGKDIANASQLLQMRMESFRQNDTWSNYTSWNNVTTGAGIQTLIAAPPLMAANFPGATETYTVKPYFAGAASAYTTLVVTRASNGTVTFNAADLSAHKAVQMTIQVSWTAVGGATRTTLLTSIISKGGL